MSKIILWSGGFDSTVMIIELAKHMSSADFTEPREINLVSIVSKVTGDTKLAREAESKVFIKRALVNAFPKVKFITHEIDVNYSTIFSGHAKLKSSGLSQPVIWVASAIPFLNDKDEVYVGYIKNDDALTRKKDILDFFKLGCKVAGKEGAFVSFPLEYFTKTDVLEILCDFNSGDLLDYITSCENVYRDDKCSDCTPCKHLKEALLNLAVSSRPSIAQVAIQKLEKWFNLIVSVRSTLESGGELKLSGGDNVVVDELVECKGDVCA